MDLEIFTIGVYGSTFESFFDKLLFNKIDAFVDIRRRRAVRGSKYSYVNSKRLQDTLKSLNINYIHILDLAPTNAIRELQKNADKETNTKKTERSTLGEVFIREYKTQVLDNYHLSYLIEYLKNINSQKAVLFCVEEVSNACHRSLVADKLKEDYSFSITNL